VRPICRKLYQKQDDDFCGESDATYRFPKVTVVNILRGKSHADPVEIPQEG
jgi:hypothetical protein